MQHFLKIELEHIHEDKLRAVFFFGQDEKNSGIAGELNLKREEWLAIACALRMGLGMMHLIGHMTGVKYTPVRVTVKGEMKALGRIDELKGAEDISVYP